MPPLALNYLTRTSLHCSHPHLQTGRLRLGEAQSKATPRLDQGATPGAPAIAQARGAGSNGGGCWDEVGFQTHGQERLVGSADGSAVGRESQRSPIRWGSCPRDLGGWSRQALSGS